MKGNMRNTRELIQKVIKAMWQGREKDANTQEKRQLKVFRDIFTGMGNTQDSKSI